MKNTIVKNMNNTFSIAYPSDYELAKKLKVGEEYECDIKRPRNYKFLKKFFALNRMVFDNQEVYSNVDDMREELTKAAGFYYCYVNHAGVKTYKAKSISFAKMSQEEFDEFYNRYLDVVVKVFHFERETIAENLEDFM